MKLAIISDVHLGDPSCTMIERDGGKYRLGRNYANFRKAVGKNNDYLVLLGDIFDFSIASYEEVYEAARVFFRQVRMDELAEELIYVPGNHDFSFWQVIQHDINVVEQIKAGQPPRRRWSVPGVIDDRDNAPYRGFQLPLVNPARVVDGKRIYGGLFLDELTKTSASDEGLRFNVAFPNLYMITREAQSVLLTHGHYFEEYWALAGGLARKIADEDLSRAAERLQMKGSPDELVSNNWPLNELASSGLGNAGALTEIIRKIQLDVKNGDLKQVRTYLDKFQEYLDEVIQFKWQQFFMEPLADGGMTRIKKVVIKMLEQYEDTRFDPAFFERPKVQQRFREFHDASVQEMDLLNARYLLSLPTRISHMIYGHTHVPLAWRSASPQLATPVDNHQIRVYNLGGWLLQKKDGKTVSTGVAEVFTYQSETGFDSVTI